MKDDLKEKTIVYEKYGDEYGNKIAKFSFYSSIAGIILFAILLATCIITEKYEILFGSIITGVGGVLSVIFGNIGIVLYIIARVHGSKPTKTLVLSIVGIVLGVIDIVIPIFMLIYGILALMVLLAKIGVSVGLGGTD